MIVTSRAYASDWSNNLWFVWEQSLNIKTLGLPSYFVQSEIGAFFPQFLFYGGTLFSVVGFVAGISGEHPLAAYILAYGVAVTAAYAGWLWLCLQLGMSGWRAHIPAILFVTSAYYVTNIYGRGDFGETVATSMIPLMVASGLRLASGKQWSVGSLAVLIAAVVFFTGSHPLTLVWGATFLALAALVLLPVLWRHAWVKTRRIAMILGVCLLGVGVNAWTLIPTLAYHNRILHGADISIQQIWYSTPEVLLSVWRNTVGPTWINGDVQTQTPVLAIGWVLIAAAVSWRSAPHVTRRAVIGLAALTGVLIWLTLSPTILSYFPKPWDNMQFPFRLLTYVTLAVCAAVAGVLLMLRTASAPLRRWLEFVLAAIAAMSIVLATKQALDTPSFVFKNRQEIFASAVSPPRSYYSGVEYADSSAPVVQPTISQIQGGAPLVMRPGIQLPASPFTATYNYPIVVGQPGTVATNIPAGPYLVTVKGAKPVGRTPLVPGGSYGISLMVVQVSGTPGEHEVISFTTTPSRALRLGVIGTCASLTAILLLLAGVLGARWRSRHRPRPIGSRSSSAGTHDPQA